MANQWFVQQAGKQFGPFTSADLKRLAAERKVTPASTIRLGQHGNWVAAARVQGLFTPEQIAALPPISDPSAPLPPEPPPVTAHPPLPPSVTPPPLTAPPKATVKASATMLPKAAPARRGSTKQADEHVLPKVLGAIAILLGLVALATCWLPIMQSAIGWTGIIVGALGLVVGIAGLIVAARQQGAGLMLNVAGAGSSVFGLAMTVGLGAAFGLFGKAPPTPVVVAPPVVAQKEPEPPPEPVQPEPPPEIVWTDASESIIQGPIKASITSAKVEQIRLEGADLSVLRPQRAQPMLKIKLSIQNITPDKIVEVPGWPGGGDMIGSGLNELLGSAGGELGQAVKSLVGSSLSDNLGNKYKQTPLGMIFGGGITLGKDAGLRPGATSPQELVFPPPLESIEYLRLELPPAGFSGSEPLRFQIPKSMIQ